jgi:hypothetical protein
MRTTPTKRRSKSKRLHNPDILRMKRAARNLGIPWREVTTERDRLRAHELTMRADDDGIRREAWIMVAGQAAEPFWRGGFQRKYRTLLSTGGDCDSVVGWDETCQQLRGVCPSVAEWSSEDIWELVISDYPPLADVMIHYTNALARLAMGLATDDGLYADTSRFNQTPF